LFDFQLEDVEVTVSDHVQKVLKPNWSASWEEIGGENELEDTYTLSIPTLEGFSYPFFLSFAI
jgi:coatomer protein complex subunit gamma